MKFKAIISLIYLLCVTVCTICLQISAIMIICKLCNVTSIAWINCCVPVIIIVLIAPVILITKNFIEK